jgi:hypothetical protein
VSTEHVDVRDQPRQGWFQKAKDDGKPQHKSYRTSCKQGNRGYLGPLHEAHHILPQTSIEESVTASAKGALDRKRFLEDVQWLTPWNINQPDNMVGLPHYHAYDLYYQQKARLESKQGDAEKSLELVEWFNHAYKQDWAERWLKRFEFTGKPEGWPIHNPVSWGHTEYNERVKRELEREVWNPLEAGKANHQEHGANVRARLVRFSNDYFELLKARGAKATREKWDERHDPDNDDWHEPFTMADVPNPLF